MIRKLIVLPLLLSLMDITKSKGKTVLFQRTNEQDTTSSMEPTETTASNAKATSDSLTTQTNNIHASEEFFTQNESYTTTTSTVTSTEDTSTTGTVQTSDTNVTSFALDTQTNNNNNVSSETEASFITQPSTTFDSRNVSFIGSKSTTESTPTVTYNTEKSSFSESIYSTYKQRTFDKTQNRFDEKSSVFPLSTSSTVTDDVRKVAADTTFNIGERLHVTIMAAVIMVLLIVLVVVGVLFCKKRHSSDDNKPISASRLYFQTQNISERLNSSEWQTRKNDPIYMVANPTEDAGHDCCTGSRYLPNGKESNKNYGHCTMQSNSGQCPSNDIAAYSSVNIKIENVVYDVPKSDRSVDEKSRVDPHYYNWKEKGKGGNSCSSTTPKLKSNHFARTIQNKRRSLVNRLDELFSKHNQTEKTSYDVSNKDPDNIYDLAIIE